MAALLLKITLGIFACIVAILGVSDHKTVEPQEDGNERSWLRRLTRIGILKICCALATLGLLGANEWVTYRTTTAASEASSEASSQAASESKALQDKLDDARQGLIVTIAQLRTLARTNDYLVATLDNSLVRAGIARVPPEEIQSRYYPLVFKGGSELQPKDGDSFEWAFVCQGRLPPIPSVEQDGNCSQAGYGRLMANGSEILLNDVSGRRSYFKSRASGEQMTYRSSAEGGLCASIATQLKALSCALGITVMREARWKFEEYKKAESLSDPRSAQDEIQDACRRFQALYGESCEAAIQQQSGTR
jgi:hypothetical protein